MRHFVICGVLLGTWLAAGDARADVSGWAYVGGGALGWQGDGQTDLVASGTVTIDMGVGSSDSNAFIGGGIFRIQPLVDRGVDVALMARFCNRSFQTSWIGFALDAGGYQRTWGNLSTGFMGQAVLGGPFGLQLAVMGAVGTEDARAFGGTLGIDFARLTVHRAHGDRWWPSPRPERRFTSALPTFILPGG